MNGVAIYEDKLSERIKGLPIDKVKEVIDYVDFLKWREIKDGEFDRFDEMIEYGRENFKKWCEKRKIDYRQLEDEKVMSLINNQVHKHRKVENAI